MSEKSACCSFTTFSSVGWKIAVGPKPTIERGTFRGLGRVWTSNRGFAGPCVIENINRRGGVEVAPEDLPFRQELARVRAWPHHIVRVEYRGGAAAVFRMPQAEGMA